MGRVNAGSAPVVIPGGRKHSDRLQTLTVRAAGSRQVLVAGSSRQVDQTLLRRAGERQRVLGRSTTSRPLRGLRASWLGGLQAGAVLPSGARSVSSGNRAARRFGNRNSEPTECAETAGSVRGAVVPPVCPCSLTVTEVGRRRRFGVDAFGCGWKRTG
jgi:hypothetical protein